MKEGESYIQCCIGLDKNVDTMRLTSGIVYVLSHIT
jgi:hypothetical protein